MLPENGDKGLKYYALIAAFGCTYDLLFRLADNNMDKEALDVHELMCLAIGNSMTDKGYVAFCYSRLENRARLRWFVMNLLIFPITRSLHNHFDTPADTMALFQ